MQIHNLCFSFGDIKLFDQLNLNIPDGQITAIMAPSGKGKTTLLRLIAGLLSPDSGSIERQDGEVGMMFQEPRLFAQLTVVQNVMLVIKNKKEKRERAMHLLQLFGVDDAADKYPEELSGGMAKRVSLARAIAYDAPILLLDEPFSGLDDQTKQIAMQHAKQELHGKTVLLVTHDINEANAFANHIITLE